MVLVLAVGGLAMAPGGGLGSGPAAGEERHAGRIQSVDPGAGLLIIEESGLAGRIESLEVEVRGARVLRVFRDPREPWRWREEPTQLARFPVGTYVVVMGQRGPSGRLEARRVEIPRLDVGN
jgi:hypothetical protein